MLCLDPMHRHQHISSYHKDRMCRHWKRRDNFLRIDQHQWTGHLLYCNTLGLSQRRSCKKPCYNRQRNCSNLLPEILGIKSPRGPFFCTTGRGTSTTIRGRGLSTWCIATRWSFRIVAAAKNLVTIASAIAVICCRISWA